MTIPLAKKSLYDKRRVCTRPSKISTKNECRQIILIQRLLLVAEKYLLGMGENYEVLKSKENVEQ